MSYSRNLNAKIHKLEKNPADEARPVMVADYRDNHPNDFSDDDEIASISLPITGGYNIDSGEDDELAMIASQNEPNELKTDRFGRTHYPRHAFSDDNDSPINHRNTESNLSAHSESSCSDGHTSPEFLFTRLTIKTPPLYSSTTYPGTNLTTSGLVRPKPQKNSTSAIVQAIQLASLPVTAASPILVSIPTPETIPAVATHIVVATHTKKRKGSSNLTSSESSYRVLLTDTVNIKRTRLESFEEQKPIYEFPAFTGSLSHTDNTLEQPTTNTL